MNIYKLISSTNIFSKQKSAINRRKLLHTVGVLISIIFLTTTGMQIESKSTDETRKLIYENSLNSIEDIEKFVLEGEAILTFPNDCLRMENKLDPSLGQKANFVLWCDENFPQNISIEWKVKPLREPGLAILFFAAKGLNGEDVFNASPQKREGIYKRYHSGDINTYHISYFRRKHNKERAFHTCNLRKSKGFKLCAIGADPIPSVEDVKDFYNLRIDKYDNQISFFINDLKILSYQDEYDDFLKEGKIGFRQMAPFVAEYKDLTVYEIK
jgi:hypothetical protein